MVMGSNTDNDTVIGTGIKIRANNFAFEVHQYLDADLSGTLARRRICNNRRRAVDRNHRMGRKQPGITCSSENVRHH